MITGKEHEYTYLKRILAKMKNFYEEMAKLQKEANKKSRKNRRVASNGAQSPTNLGDMLLSPKA